jgi:hypothetical protein
MRNASSAAAANPVPAPSGDRSQLSLNHYFGRADTPRVPPPISISTGQTPRSQAGQMPSQFSAPFDVPGALICLA